ncbi:MAG: tRNA (guanosine(46)-N7)-methyltransferase TrmB [Oscillospiraceae bacterium]|jgi:tRNA (guanine-N7-)-methyltransferase
MRIRYNRKARPALDSCAFYVRSPKDLRGRWAGEFAAGRPLYLELGCGKGSFIAETAASHPECSFIAADIKSEMLYLAMKNIEKSFGEAGREPDNVLISVMQIMLIGDYFSKEDAVDGIYINFCNPWPKHKHHKRRLTHPQQLMQYREFLKDGGSIMFRTDDDDLYRDSLGYFKSCGFSIETSGSYASRDDPARPDIAFTEHELMFLGEGKPISYLRAVKMPLSD